MRHLKILLHSGHLRCGASFTGVRGVGAGAGGEAGEGAGGGRGRGRGGGGRGGGGASATTKTFTGADKKRSASVAPLPTGIDTVGSRGAASGPDPSCSSGDVSFSIVADSSVASALLTPTSTAFQSVHSIFIRGTPQNR